MYQRKSPVKLNGSRREFRTDGPLKVEQQLLPQYVHPLVAIEVGLDECQRAGIVQRVEALDLSLNPLQVIVHDRVLLFLVRLVDGPELFRTQVFS